MIRQDRTPGRKRNEILEVELREVKLTFASSLHQFDARQRNRCAPETFETKHDICPALDVAMVLFDQIIEVFRRSNLCIFTQQAFFLHLTHRGV